VKRNRSCDPSVTLSLELPELAKVIGAVQARKSWPGHAEILAYLEARYDRKETAVTRLKVKELS
jgi:hypothetical protein